jgi:hypothetical protein
MAVSQHEALSRFDYCDGELRWKYNPEAGKRWNTVHAGKVAGCDSGHGYRKLSLNGKRIYAHQIVFLMHHGYIPQAVDHIDCDTSNNRIENLRAATKSSNGMNRRAPKSNTSGCKGVVWHKKANKWMASVTVAGRSIYLGLYTDFVEASRAANAARTEKHGDFARI